MNVTGAELRSYLELFFQTLQDTAKQYLAPELHGQLVHLSLLPAHIVCYVSTQFGVAFEYLPSTSTYIEVVTGSARVEDMLIRAPARLRSVGPMISFGGPGCGIYKFTLSGVFPFRLISTHAELTIGDVRFEAGIWKRIVNYAEVFGDRSSARWSLDKAVACAKDEVLTAIVEAGRAKERRVSLADYIQTFKKKTILLLGDYDPAGLERLHSFSKALFSLGYEPILVKDIPDYPHQDLSQKVVAIGAISRFVIVDDSSKSGHLMEVKICKDNNWVTVLMRMDGIGGSWMTAGAAHTSNVILEKAYQLATIEATLSEACKWSEAKLQELDIRFGNTYPWRTPLNDGT